MMTDADDLRRSGIRVRPVLPREFVATGVVTSRAYREFAPPDDADWQAYLQEIADVAGRATQSLVLVALCGSVITGSATLILDRSETARIRMVGVDPRRRREGVGRTLVAACITTARGAGYRVVMLHTIEAMMAAQALYESLGFERGRSERVDGMRVLSYRLDLLGNAAERFTTAASQG